MPFKGLKMIASADYRLPERIAGYIPNGIDDLIVRETLLNEYGIEIGGGLGKFKVKVWRISLMCYFCRKENMMLFLSALESILLSMDYNIQNRAIDAASKYI